MHRLLAILNLFHKLRALHGSHMLQKFDFCNSLYHNMFYIKHVLFVFLHSWHLEHFMQDYLTPQKNEKHTHVRTSFYLVSADLSLPCLIICCYAFHKMKCVYFGDTYKLRTYTIFYDTELFFIKI